MDTKTIFDLLNEKNICHSVVSSTTPLGSSDCFLIVHTNDRNKLPKSVKWEPSQHYNDILMTTIGKREMRIFRSLSDLYRPAKTSTDGIIYELRNASFYKFYKANKKRKSAA